MNDTIPRRELPPNDPTETFRSQIVRGWEAVFDRAYEGSALNAGPTFAGWNSSYTGEPIPEPEMQEWLTCTVDRIRALRATRVLEIGCGVGLLLRELAPQCEVYVGIDFAASAIDRVRRWVGNCSDLRHVELFQRTALEIQDMEPGRFDAVVLNSVAQYFPDIDYFVAVLQAAARLLVPDGYIFVGDVRHLKWLPMFHTAVQLSKAASTLSLRDLRSHIARMASQDNELIIDPELFVSLLGRLPGIRSVKTLLKRGRAQNELISYRYDVLMRIGQSPDLVARCNRLDWNAAAGSLQRLDAALRSRRWNAVYLCGIPNARVAKDEQARKLIASSDGQLEVGIVRRQLAELDIQAVDPEALWQLADEHDYEATLLPGEGDTFEAQLVSRSRIDKVPLTAFYPQTKPAPLNTYANLPFKSHFK